MAKIFSEIATIFAVLDEYLAIIVNVLVNIGKYFFE